MIRVNLIAWDNHFGLSRNLRLLRAALEAGDCSVHLSTLRRGKFSKHLRPRLVRARIAWQKLRGANVRSFDLNVFLEHIRPEYLPLARRNLLMPHPEWFLPSDRAALDAIDRVLVLTRHAAPLFEALGKPVEYVGFTSEDRLDRNVPRERTFFHLAGRSQNKGTEPLLALWRKHPEWPRLTVLQSHYTANPGPAAPNIVHRVDYIPGDELKRIQNSNRFHICPSETEGFGHYLVEAMGVGAVVLTLDAPPMNEMVTPERGVLVPYSRTGTQNLATTYFYDQASLETVVERLLATSDNELDRMGAAARTWFEGNNRAFRTRIAEAISNLP